MIHEEVDVDAYPVHVLRVDLLEMVDESCLVDVLLEWVEVEVQSLVLTHDGAPEVQNLVERVLLEPGQADRLLEDERMVLEQLLTVMGGREELGNLRTAPDDESLLRVPLLVVRHVLILLVLVLLHLVLSNLEVRQLAQRLLESFGLVAVGRDDNEIHLVLSKDLLELSPVLCVPPGSLLFAWSWFWWSSIGPASRLSRWNDVEEVLVGDELSELVDDGYGGLEVAAVERVHDGTHHVQTLSLLNEILFDGACLLALPLVELPLLVLDLEVSRAQQLLILLTAAVGHEVLGILLQLELDLLQDAHEEGLLALVCLSALSAEDLEDFPPEEPPLRGVLGVLELLEHVLEVFVADPLVLVVVVDLDLVGDQAQALVLQDVQKEVSVDELLELLVDPLDSVARMEHIKLLAALLRRLSLDDSKVANVLLEASADVWLALELDRTVDAHVLDDLEGLVAA